MPEGRPLSPSAVLRAPTGLVRRVSCPSLLQRGVWVARGLGAAVLEAAVLEAAVLGAAVLEVLGAAVPEAALPQV